MYFFIKLMDPLSSSPAESDTFTWQGGQLYRFLGIFV